MNIAYVCADFGIPVHGAKGASIHVRELSQAIQSLGHEVDIFTPRAGGDAPEGFTVPVHEIPLPASSRQLYNLLRDDPAGNESAAREIRSMVYASTMRHAVAEHVRVTRPAAIYERYSLLGTSGSDIARDWGVPHIVEVNAPLSEEQTAHRGIAFARTVRAIERQVLGGATEVVAVSDTIRDWLVEIGIDRHRVTVLPNGVDVDRFAFGSSRAAEVRARLGLPARPVIGFVGTLKAWHGTATLVQAFAELVRERGRDRAPCLLIVGEGPQRASLEGLAADLGIDDLVTFTGSAPHREMPAYLAAMDIAVAPYDHLPNHYFSPLKLFEYMAARRPIVAAAIGQILTCIDDGVTGSLYPPGNTAALAGRLAMLLDDPLRAETMGRAAQDVARPHHTWAQNAQVVLDLIANASRIAPRIDDVALVGGGH